MIAEVRVLLAQALGMLTLSACNGVSTNVSTNDYGDCDPGEAGQLPTDTFDTELSDDGATVQLADIGRAPSDADDGEDVVVCLEIPEDAPSCMDDEDAWTEAWQEAADDIAGDYPHDSPYWWYEVDYDAACGPMLIDEACCWRVGFDTVSGGSEGRPFLVHRAARTAPPTARADWAGAPAPAPVPNHARDAVAARWIRAGQAEHASVAAFARFSLVLLHHGAPPDLVTGSQQAGLDEVRHAELCFGLASAISGTDVGPGALEVTGSLDGELDLVRVVETLVLEGCVGEALAALEAAEAARQSTDPLVRQVLEGIATDESRHAALAWKTLAWLIQEHPELREVARAVLASVAPVRPAAGREDLAEHGCLGPAARRRVRRVGLREVVAPLARQVLEQTRLSRPVVADSPLPPAAS